MEPREYDTLRALEDRFWWYRGLHRLVLERMAERSIAGRPRPRILDAGCGTGGMLRRLQERYPDAELTGIDWSPLALARCGPRPGAANAGTVRRLSRASVSALPFPAASFDAVVSLDVLYHAGVADDTAALGELRRVLRPGGLLFLNLPAFEALRSSHDRAIHTARRYRTGMLRTRLQAAGLVPLRVHYWNGFLFPALALVRWVRRGDARVDRPVAPSDVRALPGVFDSLLGSALALERLWLRWAPLPFGLSVFAVARRPDGGQR